LPEDAISGGKDEGVRDPSAEFRERVLVKRDSEVLKWVSLGTLAEMAFMAKIGHVLCIERARKISKVWYQKIDIFVFWR